MARFDKSSGSREIEVQVPEGLELSDSELQQIHEEMQGELVDVVSPDRAAALKVKVIPKTEEVQPKLVVVPKVKR